jgi:oxygen-dependent protoporphyrinogen oxidase
MFDLWRSGLAAGLPYALLEPWRPQRPYNLKDESIGSFIARRADKRIADNVISAVMHGIYAGDVWKLSARTLLSTAWKLEGLYGSVWKGMINTNQESPHPEQVMMTHPYDADALRAMREGIKLDDNFVDLLAESTMFSFRNGLQELINTLQQKLEDSNQVQFKLGTYVGDLKYIAGAEPQMEVSTGVSRQRATPFYQLTTTRPTLNGKPRITTLSFPPSVTNLSPPTSPS